MSTILVIILAIIAAIAVITLGYWLLKRLAIGAVLILAWASEQEFLGVIAYFAAWVFLFPLMLVASIVVGIIQKIKEKEERREMIALAKIAQSNQLNAEKNITADCIYKDATDYEKKRGY